MTTTETPNPTTPVRPALAGIHHAGFTVRDVRASAAWYERVLLLEPLFEENHYRSDKGGYTVVLGTPDPSFSIGLDHHPSNRGEPFDEARTGLDHFCFTVASVDGLQKWAAHLDQQGVEHSGVYAMPGLPISLVTFRDPDGIQLELLAFH